MNGSMLRRLTLPLLFPGLLPFALAGCGQGYSPNTYASNAAQEEAAVQRGVIIGVRQVMISANDTLAVAAGGAAGGVAGAQAGGPVTTVLGTIGGTLAGGIGGAAAAKAIGDAKGWEYIVQEAGAKLVSVTQTSKLPLPIGLHVLVISDSQQARIVQDYTVQTAAQAPPAAAGPPAAAAPPASSPTIAVAASNAATAMVNLSPVLPSGAADPLQVTPLPASAGPADTVAPAAPAPVPASGAPTP